MLLRPFVYPGPLFGRINLRVARLSRQALAPYAVLWLLACTAALSSPTAPPRRTRIWGFVAPWDSRSDTSARRHATRLDAIVSGWIQLDSLTAEPFMAFVDTLSR